MPKHTLTGNDIARAEAAVLHALAWWKHKPRQHSDFARKEIAAYKALAAKLGEISDHAYPYEGDAMPPDCGDDTIMQLDTETVKATRATARRANRRAA